MSNVQYMVSPKYDLDYLRKGGEEAKIDVYEDRVKGWVIEQAKFVAQNEHSGFAELLIILSFFESHARYLPDAPPDAPQEYGNRFKHVFKKVFPTLTETDEASDILRTLWKDGRCGLYHGGITGKKIMLSGNDHAIAVLTNVRVTVDINPGRLVDAVEKYFDSFIQELRNSKNSELRSHFFEKFE